MPLGANGFALEQLNAQYLRLEAELATKRK
jgi:hypothetical protein